MVKRLVAILGGLDSKFEPIADLLLANEFGELPRAQPVVEVDVALVQCVAGTIVRHMSADSLVDSPVDVKDVRARPCA